MQRVMLKSKIHRATVTDSDLHYVGSITIDPDLLEAADILEHEQVHVVDVDNGARFETYTIAGERGSGAMCVNGAAAAILADSCLQEEYLALVDPDTLEPLQTLSQPAMLALAARVGEVRLIDNIFLEPTPADRSGRPVDREAIA